MTKHLQIRGNHVVQAWLCVFAMVSLLALATVGPAQEAPRTNEVKEYDAEVPKSVLELQQFRQAGSIRIRSRGGREGVATLINLNPEINVWFLLKVAWKDRSADLTFHLENPEPHARKLLLDEKYPACVVIAHGENRYFCDLFGGDALDRGKASQHIFAPLCEGRLYVRNAAAGHRTTLEAATEFLREHVWGGEKIIDLGHILMGDIHRETGRIESEAAGTKAPGGQGNLPLPAVIDSKYADRSLTSSNLGIDLEGPERTGMLPGAWYPAAGNAGIYVSILQPNLIDPVILQSYKTTVNNLDSVEASALSYLIAFDLDQFDLGYALGTEHPRVEWSDHMLEQMRNPTLPGPDGIGSISPLIATGLVSPEDARETVATFTGGFKRTHGAFKSGELALKNHGSHYGFIENGVVFSKLQPGLATIFVLDDGSIAMKTWAEADNKLLSRIKHARQNGVPVIEFDETSRSPVPGRLVGRWGPGNWSGSADEKLRTMRSGAALQTNHGKHFLIYAVFSDATPSAMARIFQAYRCDYAMLLDMNALEHTYLALYRRSGSQMFVDHLLKGMSEVDKSAAGELVPRFLGYPDNRDFFYLMRRNPKEVRP
ncbi:MAG: hypothetical protein LAP61_14760 [Acidobacteriia bacterium]|nr:hypothetical protein [Terriglobia bacterium]